MIKLIENFEDFAITRNTLESGDLTIEIEGIEKTIEKQLIKVYHAK